MTTKKMVVNIKADLESKPPIAMFVQVASQYESKIYLEVDDKRINAKSIMGMMSLALSQGDELLVSCDGTDELAALEGIADFLQA
ncbi:MAG: HPr family phosphocarrier protein [Bacteroides sp.]|nr:HPr family phosphocarrier protein [Bacteroides sp.]MCM1548360.1 HPr family phosphocarrier protein [Clostridium sp.]